MAAVKLLDLPPEIIQMIVNRCIQLHGAEAAFTLSSVHSAFKPAVARAMDSQLPLVLFRSPKGRKYFKENLRTYLQGRVKLARNGFTRNDPDAQAVTFEKLNGAHPFLPKYITKALNEVYELAIRELVDQNKYHWQDKVAELRKDETRSQLEADLCGLIAHNFECVQNASKLELLMLYDGKRITNQSMIESFNETFAFAILAAAITTVGHLDIVKLSAEHIWQHSSAFGTPFHAAAFAGNLKIIQEGLISLEHRIPPLPSNIDDALFAGLVASLHRGHFEVAKEILSSQITRFQYMRIGQYKILLNKAIMAGEGVIADTIIGLPHIGGNRCLLEAFATACASFRDHLLDSFFGSERLHPNQHYNIFKLHSPDPFFYPIMVAIRSVPSDELRFQVVEYLIRHEADPNGPKLEVGPVPVSMTPLAIALKKGCWRTVRILLDHGANLRMSTATDDQWEEKFLLLQDHLDVLVNALSHDEWNVLVDDLGIGSTLGGLTLTPIAMAVKNQRWGAVRAIFDKNPNLRRGINAYDVAIQWRDILRIIVYYHNSGRFPVVSREAFPNAVSELHSYNELLGQLRVERDLGLGIHTNMPTNMN